MKAMRITPKETPPLHSEQQICARRKCFVDATNFHAHLHCQPNSAKVMELTAKLEASDLVKIPHEVILLQLKVEKFESLALL